MNKENLQIAFGVIFLLLLWLYHTPAVETPGLETATVVKTEDTKNTDIQTGQPAPVEESLVNVNADGNASVPGDLLESFDESDLQTESGDVQSGIDLLNNPLQ